MQKYYLYVVLTRTNTIISRLIQLIKNDRYTHAAISLDKKLNSMYSFSRKHIHNPFIGIFQQEYIHKGVYGFHKKLPGIIMEVEVTREQYEKAKGLIDQFVCNSSRYKYNYVGLFFGIFNKSSCSSHRFLCSEFVYYVLKECDIVNLDVPRSLVRPQNLLGLDCNVIFEGNLKKIKAGKSKKIYNSVDRIQMPQKYAAIN